MLAANHLLNMASGVSLRDAVYETLKEAILTGELEPGERMMEIPIANRLGVSRTPVREAIKHLEKDRLVVILPKCGARVANITEKSVRDALAVRTTVEVMAVRLAAQNPTPEMIARLKKINKEINSAIEAKDIPGIFDKDNELHRVICESADNQVLSRVTVFLEELVMRYRVEYVRYIEDIGQLSNEHHNLIAAIEKADPEEAAKVLSKHIDGQCEKICSMIRERAENP